MRKPILALLGVSAILFAACGAAASPSPTAVATPAITPAPTPTPEKVDLTNTKYAPDAGKDGGQLLIGDWQEATNFQPLYLGQVTEANVASAAWAGLTVGTYDYKFAPDLAKDIPTTANGGVVVPGTNGDAMTVTWTLKDGLLWSDGKPLTCDDFKFTWSWVMDKDNTGLAGGTTGYDQITAVDCPTPTTIVYHFKSIYEGYVSLGTVLPKSYLSGIPMADQVKGKGFAPADMPNVPVSGAFKFGSVVTGQSVTLVKNSNYKGFKSNAPAHLDKLIFKWYGDPAAMITGFVNGEVDLITDLLSSDIPALKAQGVADTSISAIPSLTYEFLRPNWADGSKADATSGVGGCSRNPAVQDRGKGCPASDPAFRQALTYAVDKNAINTRILGGLEAIANTNVAPDAYYFVDQPPATFDPAKAGQILDAAGWTAGADGIRVKNGLRAKIELCSTTRQARIDTLKLIAQQLKAVGIEAIPNNVSATDIFSTFNKAKIDTPCALSHSNFDVAEHAFSVSVDPIGNYTSYHSSQFEPNGSNDAQVSDPDLDKALDAVKNTVDFVAVRRAMATFQQIYVQKTVEIPLYFRKEVEALNARVGNFFANPTSAGPTWNAVDWYVKG
ncbi:MAG: peptide ABC transporter substrate-binding protein [Chloroflexi bacterium]|nr:peptide ABC transporter substrate-binding protein [Chloroflexota bacterium]